MVVWDEVQTLHIAQQMPLPLTISCSSKSRLVLTCLHGFTFLVPAHPGGPGHILDRRAVKRLCVSVCVSVLERSDGHGVKWIRHICQTRLLLKLQPTNSGYHMLQWSSDNVSPC